MVDNTTSSFFRLFKAACEKCFGRPVDGPLSEPDCKHLSTSIEEQTGLVIGPKTIRNYSLYVFGSAEAKRENPSPATLDTLARYVLDAPKTDETKRKSEESHYPYWFKYKTHHSPVQESNTKRVSIVGVREKRIFVAISVILMVGAIWYLVAHRAQPATFVEEFDDVSDAGLENNGWRIANGERTFLQRKNSLPGHFTLFTLHGDNWPDTVGIRNLLMHEIEGDCYFVELHLSNFVPKKNWEQTGVILSEDSLLRGKVLRVAMAYNDFFAGYSKPPEIIIQGLSSAQSKNLSKPEEFVHSILFTLDPKQRHLVENMLKRSALKIEKKHGQFRFLFSNGESDLFAFKEVFTGDFDINPRYVAIYATQGLSDGKESRPVYVDKFSIFPLPCGN